jgi:hypothetical protein
VVSLQAVGDGETTITVTHNGESATVKVSVSGTKQPRDWSFRNHVVPMMTKAGCKLGRVPRCLGG